MAKPKSPSWTDCKKVIDQWPHRGLVALVQELYRLSDDNQRFLQGRLCPQNYGKLLEDAKKKIRRLMTPREVYSGRFSATKVYHFLNQFAKAVDDGLAVTELTIVGLAETLQTSSEVGDFEPIVDQFYVLFNRVEELLPHLPIESQLTAVDQLSEVARQWSGTSGYGMSDELDALAAEGAEKLRNVESTDDGGNPTPSPF